jgi:hypothetical protein
MRAIPINDLGADYFDRMNTAKAEALSPAPARGTRLRLSAR